MNENKNLKLEKIFSLAVEYHQKNEFNIAQDLYNQVIKINPNHVSSLNNLGALFKELGDIQNAKNYYEKVIEIDPNHKNSLNNLGGLFQELEEYQKAINFLEKTIEIDPCYTDAYNNLGIVFKELGENQKAINYYKKAIEIDSNFVNAHYNLGILFKDLREHQKAKNCYEKVVKINPNHANAHNNLGTVSFDLGENQKAINYYKKAIEIDPNFVNAHYNLGMVYERVTEETKSVDHYRKALINRSEINFERDKENDLKLQPATTSFFLELTNKCNFHCEFCPSDSQTRLHGFMELSLVEKIFDEISQKKIVTRVNLHLMGEPTLHPKLNEILAYAKSKNVKVDLTTNGSTLVKKKVPMLLDNISGSIVASLMTPTKDTYKIRGDVGLSWDRYIDNFRLLIKEHLKKILRGDKLEYEIVFRVMVSSKDQKGAAKVLETAVGLQENYEEWSNFTETVERELGLATFNRQEIDSDKTFSLLGDGLREVSFYLQKNIKIQFWKAFTFANTRVDDKFKLEAKTKAQFCPHPFKDFGILWNGDVSLCCLDYDATLKVGNIKTHSVEDVMKSTASKKLRASMYGLEKLHPTCVKCQSRTIEK